MHPSDEIYLILMELPCEMVIPHRRGKKGVILPSSHKRNSLMIDEALSLLNIVTDGEWCIAGIGIRRIAGAGHPEPVIISQWCSERNGQIEETYSA